MKLLAVGDMHLGRRPSRLPEELRGRAAELGPAAAFERLVGAAIEAGVDVVAFAGDLVENESDFFEAYRLLHAGVSRLSSAGVRVVGVAGNHDVRVLPRLAAQIEGFRLLGEGGLWEAEELESGGERLTLWGWSFPRPRVTESPLLGVRLKRRPGLNLGLLHCDRGGAGPYAPVSREELAAAGLDGWLLGHIHVPDNLTAASPSGYLGSVAGLDAGEAGPRGPWLLTIRGGVIEALEQWLLSPLRWEHLDVDQSGMKEPGEIRSRILGRLRSLDARLRSGAWPPAAVGLRLRLTGGRPLAEEAAGLLSAEERGFVHQGDAGTHYFIERLLASTSPELSLEQMAARSDPAGLLARRLLLLDQPADHPARAALVSSARRHLSATAKEPTWSGLAMGGPGDEEAADYLRRAGTRLLERMLAQKGTPRA